MNIAKIWALLIAGWATITGIYILVHISRSVGRED